MKATFLFSRDLELLAIQMDTILHEVEQQTHNASAEDEKLLWAFHEKLTKVSQQLKEVMKDA